MHIPKHGILTGALWPRMVDTSFGHHSFVRIAPEHMGEFPQTHTGLWLPLGSIAAKDFMAIKEHFTASRRGMGKAAFKTAELTSDGCWASKTVAGLEEDQYAGLLWDIVQLDMGGAPLNSQSAVEEQHVCDTPRCLNPRHYNFTPRLAQARTEMGLPNYELFTTMPDGSIAVDWLVDQSTGEIRTLPSVEQSAAKLRSLQRRCVPYVEYVDSVLTPSGISKITLDNTTGCWMVQSFYTRDKSVIANGRYKTAQYDGYGRLAPGPALHKDAAVPNYNQLAHRVVPQAFGISVPVHKEEGRVQELDHMCGVRRCCNPDHLEVVTKRVNNERARERRKRARSLTMDTLF